jgi:trehalose 6-phosphate phosphatase
MTLLDESVTPAGRAGLTALLDQPKGALIGLDFDGTLAPIVPDPRDSRALPGIIPVLTRLAGSVGTLAVITGRTVAEAVGLGGLAEVPGIVVLGHYGAERWQDGTVTAPDVPPAVEQARAALPGLLRDSGAPDGTWIEDKHYSLAVHTRRTAHPDAALELLRGPLTALAAELGLAAEPGRQIVELRPGRVDKGSALIGLVRETSASSDIYCGDDLGDLPAFAAVRTLRGEGIPGCAVASGSAEASEVAAAADLVVAGPAGILRLLDEIAAVLEDR